MSPTLATLAYGVLIAGLFLLNRDKREKTSAALWLPVIWLGISCSRPISLWLASFGFPITVVQADSPEQYLDGSPVDRNVLLVFLILAIVVLLRRRKQITRLLQANWPIILFFFYAAFSTLWSDFPEVAFKRWVKAVGNIVMALIVLTDPEPIPALKRLFTRVAFVLVPVSILYIKYFPELGRSYNRWTWQPFFTGVTDNKNGLGMLCLISGVGALWCLTKWWSEDRKTRKNGVLIAISVVLVMVGWLFYMANSMTSLSCFTMAAVLLIVTQTKTIRKRPALIHLVVVAMICTSVYALFFDASGDLVENLGRDATLTGRTQLWHVVLGMTSSPLFGTGYESFWLGSRLDKLWSIYWWHPNEAHNGYLEIYLSLGWIGVALTAAVLAAGYRNVIAAIRSDQKDANLRVAFFVAAVVYNISEAAFKGTNPLWTAFFVAVYWAPLEYLVYPAHSIDSEGTNPLPLNRFSAAEYQCDPSKEGMDVLLNSPVLKDIDSVGHGLKN